MSTYANQVAVVTGGSINGVELSVDGGFTQI
jgi:hypothetical protein